MSTATALDRSDGGLAARRAIMRWSLRLYRREWRQQVLICILMALAVAATIFGAGVVTGSQVSPNAQFGTANHMSTLSGGDPRLGQELAALRSHFGPVAVIDSSTLTTGTAQGALIESLNRSDPFVGPLVQLASGRYPTRADEVALSAPLAALYGLHVGDVWHVQGRDLRVVGEVRQPTDLNSQFAVLAPGALPKPDTVTVLFDATPAQLASFRPPRAIYNTLVFSFSVPQPPGFNIGEFIVLVAATFGMLFIGLIAVAGFTVMAQRRARSIGMLGALGAAESKVRLVVLMNGLVLGLLAMVAGGALGLASWWLYAPHQQASVGHVVDAAAIPIWLVVAALLLAPLTATLAAWRPARTAAKQPVVASLSGRPSEPHASRRNAAIGASVFAGGIIVVYAASGGGGGGGGKAPVVLGGLVATCIGLFLVAQWVVAQFGRVAKRVPLSSRIALRDLARYRSRSGAALGAICLAIVITAVVVIAATARYSDPFDWVGPNLANNVVMVYPPPSGPVTKCDPYPQCTQITTVTPQNPRAFARVTEEIAHSIGATSTLPLYLTNANVNRTTPGRSFNGNVFVATPALLRHYGVNPSSIDPNAMLLTSRSTLPGAASQLALTYGAANNPSFEGGNAGPCPPGYCVPSPVTQLVPQLPSGTSAPNTLLTMHAVRSLHLTMALAQYQLTTPKALTNQQWLAARTIASDGSDSVEAATSFASLNEVLSWAIAIGLLVALGVLAMTVGLIRAETSFELRVLSAAGASRRTRRALTAITAAALGFVGAVLGVFTAYLLVGAFLANNFSNNLSELQTNLPLRPLGVLVLGLPLIAAIGGWLFAAREPASISRAPLE